MPDSPLAAVSRALTNAQARAIRARFARANPHWEGAAIPDILEALAGSDNGLARLEPFCEANPGLAQIPGAVYAIWALIWAGEELTAEALRGLLAKAGLLTEYHNDLPVLPPNLARAAADELRIRVLGVRAGWEAWAAREADEYRAASGDPAGGDDRWQELMAADEALRAAEAQLERAMELITKEVPGA